MTKEAAASSDQLHAGYLTISDKFSVDRFSSEVAAENTVREFEQWASSLLITTDEELQDATDRAFRLSRTQEKLLKFWAGPKEYYYRRYKTVMSLTENGIPEKGVVGSSRLDAVRKLFDDAVRKFHRARKEETLRRQESINRAYREDSAEVERRAREAALQGDMKKAREIKAEAESLAAGVATIIPRPIEVSGMSLGESCKGSVDSPEDMMRLVKAVADGTVPLFHKMQARGGGGEVDRCIFEVSTPVLNQKVRELGKSLNYPGVTVREDISISVRK